MTNIGKDASAARQTGGLADRVGKHDKQRERQSNIQTGIGTARQIERQMESEGGD